MTTPLTPSITSETLVADSLIAGDLKLVTKSVTIAAGADLVRGAVLGKITASGKYALSASAAVDGSQTPCAILVTDAAAAAADVDASIYQMGEFNAAALSFGTGHTADTVEAALNDAGIYLKNIVSSADPS